jgi:teichuronic acid exporter
MTKKISNNQIFSSLFWKLTERGGVQGISFVVSIVLARILTPKEYGIIALVLIFVNLASVFVQSGFNTALIQKKNTDSLDFSTIFYFSCTVAFILYLILFFSSPLVANFYHQPMLIPVIRVLSIILFFGAVNSIQVAIISRNMQFKKLFYSSIGGVLVSGLIGIVMALLDFGIWALVGQQITSQLFTTIIMWFTVKWRPQFQFSYNRLKALFSYGWKILVASLVDALYLDLRSLVIGKVFSPEMVGYFNRGKQFPTIIVNNIDGSIQSVMLPTYSSHQDDRKRVKSIMKRSITTSSFIVFPMMIGLALVAEPLITLILTDKWLPSVPFLQIYCLVYAIRPLLTANIQATKGLGYSGAYLKIEMVNKVIGVIILVISVRFGVLAITWGVLIGNIISIFTYAYPNVKLLNYSIIEQIRDVLPAMLLSLIMGVFVNLVSLIDTSLILMIVVKICTGLFVYLFISIAFKIESLTYLLNILKIIRDKK